MMPYNAYQIRSQIDSLVEPLLDEWGYELVDVEYLSERGRWVLRLYIDKVGGVTIDDCVRVSREIGDLIDVKDIVAHEYVLEVSSPGLNRPLKKERDFLRYLGRIIKVRMKAPIHGRRNFTGHLRDFQSGMLYLEIEKETVALHWQDMDRAYLIYDFTNEKMA
jgi:ribosome maturation factor RimP